MKSVMWIAAIAIWLLTACNYTDGECWSRSEDDGQVGEGGGPIVPGGGGYGGYGAVPPEPQGAGDSIPPECIAIGGFSSSLFKFKTILADDPGAVAGGWQAADPTLKFVDTRYDPPPTWSCTFNFGIPLRTVAHGKISASEAADIAAEVATLASGITMRKKAAWVPADFCNQFITDMKTVLFDKSGPYIGYGARVKP